MAPDDAPRLRSQALREVARALEADPLFSPLPALTLAAERTLGEGGMGVVRLVADRRLGRRAALKLSKATDESSVRRFLREARVTARLDHPGIPPVYDAGRIASGEPFILMRFVDGRTLEDVARSGAPLRELVAILVKVADAVAYANSKGIVHRDLKPANVMVGAFGEVLVMDWGIAKVPGEADERSLGQAIDPEAQAVTRADVLLGTPGFAAPEQVSGEGEVDARADVFGLGAMLCDLLTGKTPISGTSMLELLSSTVQGRIARPRDLRPDVAPELDAIAFTATRFAPEDRYESAAAFARDLEAWLEGREPSVYRRGAFARILRLARAHPGVFASGVVAVAASLAATGVFAAKNAQLARTLSERDAAARARDAADARREAVEKAQRLLVEARDMKLRGAPPQDVARRVEESIAAAPIEGVLYESARLLERVTGGHERAAALYRRIADEFPPGFEALLRLSQVQLGLGRDGEPALDEIIARAKARSEDTVLVHEAAALRAYRRHDYPLALEHADRAVERFPKKANGWRVRAITREIMGDLEGALADSEEFIAIENRDAGMLALRARVRMRRGDHDGARVDLDRAIELDPEAAVVWISRARLRDATGDLAGMVADLTRAIELAPGAADVVLTRAEARRRLGETKLGLADAERAVELAPKLADAWAMRGVLRAATGDVAGGIPDIEKAIELAPDVPEAQKRRAYVEQLRTRKGN